jgi:hypothetical protein
MAFPTPTTQFTKDILGNYVCNSFSEAVASGLFDVVIVGGGTFGLALAQDLFFRGRKQGTQVRTTVRRRPTVPTRKRTITTECEEGDSNPHGC